MLTAAVLGALVASTFASPLGFSPADPVSLFKRISSGCSTAGTASCSSQSSSVPDTCCTEYPGGILLQTQFWDTLPSTGPTNSWTIHGLWPDNCNGTYAKNCDSSRDYTDIAALLTAQGASDTLAFMQEYWLNSYGTSEKLWEHEWATHGTCMSTLETSCLPAGSAKGAEAVAFYQTVVKLFKTLPTYTWLANAGITPSSSKTYTLTAINAALVAGSGGFTPRLGCTRSGTLTSISWYFHLKGSVIDGMFVPMNSPKAGTSCSGSAIKYALKTGSPAASTTSTTKTGTTSTSAPSSTSPASSIPTKATINASTGTGGLLSAGTLSTQTPATYTLSGTASSFTLTSSKGRCGIVSAAFTCGSGVTASSFSAVTSGSSLLLAYNGSTGWTSSGILSGSTVEVVHPGGSLADAYLSVEQAAFQHTLFELHLLS
ncbi:ribonuclease T2 [Athelia psychrophila]|uniref:Ribonuclease T2-like n=1 Tax=Athelia psychrophila TaxID=1759441 RepID=A0A166CXC3_9AGAM|nr:ribonuclease T2 [Fibularhizoctonia sp. CBS 109695]